MIQHIYHLIHRSEDQRWHLEQEGGEDVGSFETKAIGVLLGKHRGADALRNYGSCSQLIVHAENGAVETAFTYGRDAR
jgi:hypothetical protein